MKNESRISVRTLTAMALLIARIPNALVRTAVNTVLLRILLENRALMAVAKR